MGTPVSFIQCYRLRLACIWLAVVVVLALLAVAEIKSGTRFESNILALLPKDNHFPFQQQVEKSAQTAFENQVVYLIETGTDNLDKRYQKFLNHLEKKSQQYGLRFKTEQDFVRESGEWVTYFSQYRYMLLDDKSRDILVDGKAGDLVDKQLRKIFGPIPVHTLVPFAEDPFSLFETWVMSLQGQAGELDPATSSFIYHHEGKNYKPVLIQFDGNPFSEASQSGLKKLQQEVEQVFDLPTQAVFKMGLVFHVVAGAEQAKREISTIGLISMLTIIVLFLLVYRSAVPLILTMLAIAVGCLNALATCLLIFENLHLVTLAFGTSLIGVSVDYCFHYFSAKKYFGDTEQTIQHITIAIFIGLASSVFAYGAQLVTPFPGLRQLAVFSVVGLISVWLTVILVFPLAEKLKTPATKWLLFRMPMVKTARDGYVKSTWLLFVALGMVIFFGLQKLDSNDDIRLLRTSPASLVEEDMTVRAIMGRENSGRHFVVYAETQEELLRAEESLIHVLRTEVSKGRLDSVEALSAAVPSIQTQRENYALQNHHIYGDTGQIDALGSALGMGQAEAALFRQKFDSVHGQFITLDEWLLKLPDNYLAHLYLGPLTDESGNTAYVSIVNISGTSSSGYLQSLLEDSALQKHVYLIDKAGSISEVLKHYRIEMTFIGMAAFLVIFFMLFLRYGKSVIRVIAPVLLASLLVLSMLGIFNIALNLFCVLGFFLLLGVGLDIGIFLQENHAEVHAREAVTLSAITTMLAFGLLSLSSTPVLHYFGIIVLPGIAITWLLALALFDNYQIERSSLA